MTFRSRVNSPGAIRCVDSVNGHPQPCPCGLCEIAASWHEPPPILNVHVWGVPNRLYGATINSEGDAV